MVIYNHYNHGDKYICHLYKSPYNLLFLLFISNHYNITIFSPSPYRSAGRGWQLELQWPGELVETQRDGEMTQK